jgi:uroporphyrinogen decarboxylase
MNSRERILAAIHHPPVDRVPIDFGGTRQSGISVWAYARLRQHLGLASKRVPRIFDVYQMLAEIEQGVAERFGADCVALNRPAVAFGCRPGGIWRFDTRYRTIDTCPALRRGSDADGRI